MIREGYKANFNTLVLAAKNGDLALVDCQDRKTGAQVHVVCAVYVDAKGMYNMVPVAKLFDGDPYEEVNPLNSEGGYADETSEETHLGKA